MGETTDEARMNVAAVKRVDPYARDIVDSATHVALYTFEGNEWEKTSIEGALFVYSRTGKPFHSMVIMNRLNINNLIEPVTEGLELQVQEPFLLYRNSKRRIYGIWFYDRDECSRVAARINGLSKENSNNNSVSNADRMVPPMPQGQGSVDIFSMLSKAQVEYNSTKGLGGAPSKDNLPQAPRTLDVTSQSVMDFFAKAGGGSVQLPGPPPPGPIFGPQRPAPDTREGPMLLQRLMSNPVHSVEHIEKQQRSVTPGESTSSTSKRSNASKINTTPNKNNQNKVEVGSSNQTQPRILSKVEANNIHIDAETNGQTGLEHSMCYMRVGSPKAVSPLSNFINQSQQSLKLNDETEVKPVSVACDVTTPQKPALMPPTMFTSSASKTNAERPTLESMLTPIRPVVVNDEVRPEPLTRNQLLQAFNYLIKNDAEFVNKLHEAYVKSFSELVS